MPKVSPESVFDEQIERKIIELLKNAKYSIRVASFEFNRENLLNILCHKAKEIYVEALTDKKQNKSNDFKKKLQSSGGNFFSYDNDNGNYANMHHKFCVIDDRFLITGSFNWTNNASMHSNENIVIIDDYDVADKYITEFNKLKEKESKSDFFFTISKNVVRREDRVEVSWNLPNAKWVKVNDREYSVRGGITRTILSTKDFHLSSDIFEKKISVIVAEVPVFERFECNKRLSRNGEEIVISWCVKGADKVELESYGEVNPEGSCQLNPKHDETYQLIAYNITGDKYTKDLIVRVPDFEVPHLKTIEVPFPRIEMDISFLANTPSFYKDIFPQNLYSIFKNQLEIPDEIIRPEQINHSIDNQETTFKDFSGMTEGFFEQLLSKLHKKNSHGRKHPNTRVPKP